MKAIGAKAWKLSNRRLKVRYLLILTIFTIFYRKALFQPPFKKNVGRNRKICLQQNFNISLAPKMLKWWILRIIESYVILNGYLPKNDENWSKLAQLQFINPKSSKKTVSTVWLNKPVPWRRMWWIYMIIINLISTIKFLCTLIVKLMKY